MAVLTRLFALFLSFLTVGNLRSVQHSLNEARPSGWLDQGAFHRVFFDADEAGELQWLRERGAILKEVDYGLRVMAFVDESFVGGRTALLGKDWNIRDDQNRVLFDGLPLDTTRAQETLGKLDPVLRTSALGGRAMDAEAGLYIVQFIGPVKDEWLSEVETTGADCFQPVPWNAYVARVAPENTAALENLARLREEIQYVGVYEPVFRMTPRLRNAWLDEAGSELDVTVQLVDGSGVRAELERLRGESGAWLGHSRVGPYLNVSMSIDPAKLPEIARRTRVFAIEERGKRRRLDEAQDQIIAGNLTGSSPSGPGYLAWLAGKGFTSSQFSTFSVNVVDDATSLTGHADVPNARVDFTLNPSGQGGLQGGHGFLNAHIVGGFNDGTGSTLEDASGFNYGLGVAPWAHVGSTAIFGPGGSNPSSYESSAYGSGSRISTNSWSFTTGGGAPIPDYDSNSQEYDFLTRDAQSGTAGNQEYLVLFAAGNDGAGANTVSTPSTAKNIITVGASENVRQTGTDGCGVANSGANSADDMASFSSRGPINSAGGDGRWKPEIVAPGTHVQAGVPQSNFDGGSSVCNGSWPPGSSLYGWSSGTSHSTPALAGGAALVYQWFLNQAQPLPSPALTKAILVNSADYMNGSGANDTLPSNAQGMGRMFLERAFDTVPKIIVDQSQLLSATGTSFALGGDVADISKPFRVSLVWTDAPGPTTGAPYVNDLDLTVNVGGSTYRGNVFSGANSVTGGTADFRNNTESVFLPAGVTGPFTVTVNGTSISGDGLPGNGDSTDQDFALYVYNGTQGTGPNAQFGGAPTSGIAPLAVAFTDFSTGNITSWSWTFGDGGSSTLQNPSHTYGAIGTYDVALTVNGPDGPDTNTKLAYIDAQAPPPPGISDNSFESQTAGTAPNTPWSVFFGSGHVVNPDGTASDNGFASHGSNWAEVAADSTDGATPPSNPGGVTSPPIGGAGISQDFTYPAGMAQLEFEASFLRNESANQTTFNDWMSVDVSDGTTTINLFYKDTFSAATQTSVKYGYAMTALETVTADLGVLFPSSTSTTLFTLTLQAGNGNDNIQPSKGYVDNFRFTSTISAPVANFSGTPTSGNVPLSVNFTDLSSGSVTAWSWTFGDGGSSSAQNPSHTYTAAGSYTVSLTATGPGGSDGETKLDYIVVNELPPVANFSATPLSGVEPLLVDFTDLTSGLVTAWAWSFGDTATSATQNPQHTYAAAGTYTVTLTATGPGGSDGETKLDYITVNNAPPVANFSGTPQTLIGGGTVSFSDLSTGAISARSWSFGDGGTSSLQNPTHTYNAVGTYTVALTASGPGGSHTETKPGYITVLAPTVADFAGAPTSGVAPLNVAFSDQSSGSPSTWSWSFGDTNSASTQNPTHTYASAGTYTVSLTANGPGGSDTATKTNYIVVNEAPPVADFSGTPLNGVEPLNVAFTDLTSGAVTSWAWNFGDTATSSVQDPTHTYTAAGTYTVALTANGPGGSDSETKLGYITVNDAPPVADFQGSPTTLIGSGPVTFTDLSTGAISAYSWSFGDGGTASTENPTHTYSAVGTYTVALTVNGPGGTDTRTRAGYITVLEPTAAEFSGTPLSGVAPLSVNFSDLSTGAPNTWAWTFGDGGSSSAQNPSHTYAAPGTYNVSLSANGPGGADTLSKTGYITVFEAVVADFSGTPTSGVAPLSVSFTDLTTGGSANAWTFGDGGSSSLQNPSTTYTAPGTYTVSMTASGAGGSDTATKADYITVFAPVVADFSGTPTSGVAPLSVTFTDLTTGGSANAWTFGDGGSSSLQNPSTTYTAPGTYTVSMTASGAGGSDTATKADYITVFAPVVADFSGTPTSGVAPLSVSFTDLTTGGSANAWTFGDGGSSSLQNPSTTYTAPGTYTVSMTASGAGGSDTATKADYITVFAPVVADFSGTPTSGVAPLSVSFTDLTTGGSANAWTFGDGGSSSLQNPSTTYTAPGTYTVSMTATGAGGSDTATRTDYITVFAPVVADFSGTPTSGVAPLSVSFTDLTTGGSANTWTFGDGGSSSLQNPSTTYTAPGTYTVSMTASGPGGSDTATKTDYITVFAPVVADFSGSPTSGVAPLSVSFTDLTTGGSANAWTFGDGGSSSAQNPSTTYTAPGTYTVSMTASGAGGSDTATKADYITVFAPVVADFSGTPTSGVAPLSVSFTDLTSGGTASSWNFGDGGSSSLQNPSYTYTAPGTYTVAMTANGPGGSDTATKPAYITVVGPTVADFNATPTSGVVPLSVAFTDATTPTASSWNWNFGDGGTSAAQNPGHTYVTAGTYTVSLSATGPGGTDSEIKTSFIIVNEPAPLAMFSGTPTTGSAPLNVSFTDLSSGPVTSWSWSFGDTQSSNLQNPAHTYASAGTYTVSLLVTGPGGSDTETKPSYITVDPPAPVADFSGTPTSGVAPLTVAFSDLTSGAVSGWAWNFGDGNSSTLQNPLNTYALPGTYTVSLTASGPGGSSGPATKPDYIVVNTPPPGAAFSAAPTSGIAPLSVAFSDLSTGVVSSWAWSFGDGNSATLQHPSHVYATAGTYTVTLNVTGPGGSDGESKPGYIVVSEPAPVADFSGTPTSGIEPLNVAFTDQSSGAITSYAWSFGDGGLASIQNPTHTYASAGTYTVALTVNGPGGSSTETKPGYISVGNAPPLAAFSGTPTTGIGSLAVSFTDASSGLVSAYSWDFGDGGVSTLQNPTHTYGPGTYTVTLNVAGPGGVDGETKLDYITVLEATVADFNATPLSGTAPLLVSFSDATTPLASSWSWSFGDAGSSSLQNPTHTYASAGTYTVSLTATGSGGADTATKTDYIVVNPPATATYRNGSGVNPACYTAGAPVLGTAWTAGVDSSVVPGAIATIIFARANAIAPLNTVFGELLIDPGSNFLFDSIRVSSGGIDTHTFLLPNNPALIGRIAETQAMVYVNATTAQFCNGATVVIGYAPSVAKPAAAFTATPTSGVAPLSVNFSDASSGSITSWTWNFGDGSSSTAQNPVHTYTSAGIYTVSLVVEGPNGYDTEVKSGHINVAASLVAGRNGTTTSAAPSGSVGGSAPTPHSTGDDSDAGAEY